LPGRTQPFGRIFPAEPPGAASATVSSKTTASPTPGRLPSTSALSPARSGFGFRFYLSGSRPSEPSPCFRMSDRPEPKDHRQPATVLTALPPRAGFGHPFARRARARGAKASRLDPTLSAAVTRRGADLDQDASRRLLQSEQSTSTTGGSTDPRSKLAGAAPPACAGLGAELRMGLKPSAMPITGSGWRRPTFPSRRALRPHETGAGRSRGSIRHVVLHQPRAHGSGAGRLSPFSTSHLARYAYETREALGTVSVSRRSNPR
jgi:hypothetical protein